MSEPQRPLRVFPSIAKHSGHRLCHASADKMMVRELYRTLKRRCVQPWLDAEGFDRLNLPDWELEIRTAHRKWRIIFE